MIFKRLASGILALIVTVIFFLLARKVSGDGESSQNEIKPYAFAQLPHGRIYKMVHEGCELFITETDSQGSTGVTYTIATGRGCK